ncbi:unnamed protein product [Haemonchus placei]|uniref:Uncharacterized protein n=1 Tax=Haemonchus placei TaxID=6290 RepID=A0A0N4WJP2_HAEPC|nr:unnamed protein product [Haemonchus placei]
MRIPGVEPFHTSPLTSFGEMLFGTTKTILNTSQISAFDNKASVMLELNSSDCCTFWSKREHILQGLPSIA